MSQRPSTVLLRGGMDLETPAIAVGDGHAIGGENYEPTENGYRRLDGYERFDGQLLASKAGYWTMNFERALAGFVEGETVTGSSSGATGIVLRDAAVVDGTGTLALWSVTGDFQHNEQLLVASTMRALANGPALPDAGRTLDERLDLRHAAQEAQRTRILRPVGSGPIRGVWTYAGDVYCIRDAEDGLSANLLKATGSGWIVCDLGWRVHFKSGQAEPEEGETITGGTSGATAVISRVCHMKGDWSGSAAVGHLALKNVAGAFQDGEDLVVDGTVIAAADGYDVTNNLEPGGHYDFDNYNFYATTGLLRMYGAGGVGTAFEWDGEVFAPIFTGMADDRPTRIRGHANHLFLGFPGGSLQHSAIGAPFQWTAVTGAAELGIGDEISGMTAEYAGTMVLFTRNRIRILYGTSIDDWELRPFSDDSGAKPWTIQRLGEPLFTDDGGVRQLSTSQRYGDFRATTLTMAVQRLMDGKIRIGVEPVASLRSKAKNQYRLYWADGSGISIFMGRKYPETMPFRLPASIACTCASEDVFGNELLFAGTADGWVVAMDSGHNFDGEAVRAFVRLAFNHLGAPFYNKRFHKVHLELGSGEVATLDIIADFGFGDEEAAPSVSAVGGGGFWDEAFWDRFIWSAPYQGQASTHIDGIGRNVSIVVASESAREDVHTLQTSTIYWTARGLQR